MATGTVKSLVSTLNSNLNRKLEISTAYSFDGTPDSDGLIVTDLRLSSGFYPITVINPSRQGWVYLFARYNNVSTTYWCVRVLNANASSGNFSGTIVAVG